ncbi:MAG: DNA N-6-adenine-methyltransferase [Microcoleus sp.]
MSDNFYTPDWLIDEVVEFYGGELDLDPSADAGKRIPAVSHYTIKENGLKFYWDAKTIYCNPPYSRSPASNISKWVDKAVDSHEKFGGETLLLLPASTDTVWCQKLLSNAAACLFFKGRINFLDENYKPTKGTGKFASMLAYLGTWEKTFERQFNKYGVVK